MFNGVREKRLLCGTIVHNTEETGSGRMQIDGGTPGNFPTREQQKKKKAKPAFWKTVRLPVDLGVGGRLTAGVGSYGQGGVKL